MSPRERPERGEGRPPRPPRPEIEPDHETLSNGKKPLNRDLIETIRRAWEPGMLGLNGLDFERVIQMLRDYDTLARTVVKKARDDHGTSNAEVGRLMQANERARQLADKQSAEITRLKKELRDEQLKPKTMLIKGRPGIKSR